MCNRVWSDLFLAKGEKSDLSRIYEVVIDIDGDFDANMSI